MINSTNLFQFFPIAFFAMVMDIVGLINASRTQHHQHSDDRTIGQQGQQPEMLAGRPRSIGITETGNDFIASFVEALMAIANETMEIWIKGVVNNKTA